MESEGITHVAILPLAVIPGETCFRLVWMVDALRKMPTKFRKISLARPFFGAPEDIRQTCQTVLEILPGHADEGEAVVLFFEEQSRLGDYIFPGLQYYFWQLDEPVFIGTAGTTPGMQDVFHSLKNSSAADVYLVPFLPLPDPGAGRLEKGPGRQWLRRKADQRTADGSKRNFGCYDFAPQSGP